MTQTIDNLYEKAVDFEPQINLKDAQIVLSLKEVNEKLAKTLLNSSKIEL